MQRMGRYNLCKSVCKSEIILGLIGDPRKMQHIITLVKLLFLTRFHQLSQQKLFYSF